jgi:hypothetical protein
MDRVCLLITLAQIGCITFIEPAYQKLGSDLTVDVQLTVDPQTQKPVAKPKPILILAVVIPPGPDRTLFVEADGSFFPGDVGPSGRAAIAKVFIELVNADTGVTETVSNEALIDWSQSNHPVQHSFNVLGAPTKKPGTYSVRLMAVPLQDAFQSFSALKVSGDTSLAVMAPRAKTVEHPLQADSPTDAPDFNFGAHYLPDNFSSPITLPDDIVEHRALLSHDLDLTVDARPWTVLASGTSYLPTNNGNANRPIGDAMWGLYVDGFNCGNAVSTWTVNDLQENSEYFAPMFVQGFFDTIPCRTSTKFDYGPPRPLPTGNQHSITLDATKFPLHASQPNNRVQYRVTGGARMVVLSGVTPVQGSASKAQDINSAVESMVADNLLVVPVIPIGRDLELAVTNPAKPIHIPLDHNGVVFFTAKTRMMGFTSDEAGQFSLWIEICELDAAGAPVDCHRTSPHAIQKTVGSDSQRTLSASYLATGEDRLTPGKNYRATAKGRAEPFPGYETLAYKNAVMLIDVPLIWFDGEGTAP